MRALTEQDLAWLESRIGKKRWTPEDMGRIIADLRAAKTINQLWLDLHPNREGKCS